MDEDGDGPLSPETTRFIYDGNDVWRSLDEQGEVTHRYLHGPKQDQALADDTADGNVVWALHDHARTAHVLVDHAGSVLNQITYDSFGNILTQTNSEVKFLLLFAGREFDSATGLHFFRARWYDPSVGRFIGQDPLAFAAGDTNLYRYVGNDPLNFVDPSGLDRKGAQDGEAEDGIGPSDMAGRLEQLLSAVESGEGAEFLVDLGVSGDHLRLYIQRQKALAALADAKKTFEAATKASIAATGKLVRRGFFEPLAPLLRQRFANALDAAIDAEDALLAAARRAGSTAKALKESGSATGRVADKIRGLRSAGSIFGFALAGGLELYDNPTSTTRLGRLCNAAGVGGLNAIPHLALFNGLSAIADAGFEFLLYPLLGIKCTPPPKAFDVTFGNAVRGVTAVVESVATADLSPVDHFTRQNRRGELGLLSQETGSLGEALGAALSDTRNALSVDRTDPIARREAARRSLQTLNRIRSGKFGSLAQGAFSGLSSVFSSAVKRLRS